MGHSECRVPERHQIQRHRSPSLLCSGTLSRESVRIFVPTPDLPGKSKSLQEPSQAELEDSWGLHCLPAGDLRVLLGFSVFSAGGGGGGRSRIKDLETPARSAVPFQPRNRSKEPSPTFFKVPRPGHLPLRPGRAPRAVRLGTLHSCTAGRAGLEVAGLGAGPRGGVPAIASNCPLLLPAPAASLCHPPRHRRAPQRRLVPASPSFSLGSPPRDTRGGRAPNRGEGRTFPGEPLPYSN